MLKDLMLAVAALGGVWLLLQPFTTRVTIYLLVLPFVTYLQIHVPFQGWSLVPTAVLLLTAAAAIGVPNRSGRSRPAKGLTVVVLLYGGLALVEAFNPDLPSLTLGLRGARLVVEPMLLYFIGAEVARRPDLTSRVIKLLVVTGAVVAVYGLKQAVFGFDHREALFYISNLQDVTLHEQRVFSTMAGASVFGNYMGLVAFLCVGLIVNGSRRVTALSVLLVICGFDMLVSGQRGVIVGALFGCVVTGGMALIRRRSRRRGVHMAQALTLLIAVLVGLVIITPVQARSTLRMQHESAFQAARLKLAFLKEPNKDASVKIRELRLHQLGHSLETVPLGAGTGLNLLVGSVAKVKAHSVLGTSGYGGASYVPPVPPIPGELYFYNVGSEMGLPGLSLFSALLIFGLLAAVGVGIRHRDDRKATLAFCAAGFMALVLVDSFTVDSMTANQVASYFWLFIGIVGRWAHEDRLPGPAQRSVSRSNEPETMIPLAPAVAGLTATAP